jgi:hypothetical protein
MKSQSASYAADNDIAPRKRPPPGGTQRQQTIAAVGQLPENNAGAEKNCRRQNETTRMSRRRG